MSLRITKINDLVRDLISESIRKDLSLKAGVILTVSKVDTTRNLRHARISVSVFPEEETEYAMKTLRKETGNLQKKLNDKLYMKPLPKISFLSDTTEREADIVEKILKDLF